MTGFAKARVFDMKDAFMLFFTPAIEKIIIDNTNTYGREVNGASHIELTSELLRAFVGVLILSGTTKSKNETVHGMFDDKVGRPLYNVGESVLVYSPNYSFRQRYESTTQRSTDKLAPTRELWDLWSESLLHFYNPCECVTVDEQLLGFHGRCPFRQYMKSKPERYGIKFWVNRTVPE